MIDWCNYVSLQAPSKTDATPEFSLPVLSTSQIRHVFMYAMQEQNLELPTTTTLFGTTHTFQMMKKSQNSTFKVHFFGL